MYQPILTDAETMDLLIAFYSEALQFLKVPRNQWADVKMGVYSNTSDENIHIINIDYIKRKIIICLPVIKMFLASSPGFHGDAPSFYRYNGYKLARLWQQYIKTGQQKIFEQDNDSYIFAIALGIIKGVPLTNAPYNDNLQRIANSYRTAAIRMLREEFGIDCCIKRGYDLSNKMEGAFVSLTNEEFLRRSNELLSLRDASNKYFLPKIKEGEPGSKSNPFANVDEAADYILTIQKNRLDTDTYRQKIKNEDFYYDYERGNFRIPWASANVSYYPLNGAAYPCFVVNQLSQRPGYSHEMPRFSIKPSLANNKFLFRGQSDFLIHVSPTCSGIR